MPEEIRPHRYDARGWIDLISSSGDPGWGNMNTWEQEVCRLHDDIRCNPGKYAELLRKEWIPTYDKERNALLLPNGTMLLKEGLTVVQECATFLEKAAKDKWKPVTERMKPSARMAAAAQVHSHVNGCLGGDAHDNPAIVPESRWKDIAESFKFEESDGKNTKTGRREIVTKVEVSAKKSDMTGPDARNTFMGGGKSKYSVAENCDFGGTTPFEVVMGLTIDDGVPSRGHRENIFTKGFKRIGCGVSFHAFSMTTTTVNYDTDDKDEHHKLAAEQLKSLGKRTMRLEIKDFPPGVDIHEGLKLITCQKCGEAALKLNNHHFTQLEKKDGTMYDIHKKCVLCPECKTIIETGHYCWDDETEDDPYHQWFHPGCIAKHFDLFCIICKADPITAMHGTRMVGDLDLEVFEFLELKPRREPRISKDYLCKVCAPKVDDGFKARNQKILKDMDERNKKREEEERKLKTCKGCGKYIEDTPLNVDGILWHRACYEDSECGTCIYCKKAIKVADSRVDEEDGPLHYDCLKKWLSNGQRPEGAPTPSGSALNAVRQKQEEEAAAAATAALEICAQCNKPIEGRSLQAPGKGWVHEECLLDAMSEPCKHCGEPTYPKLTGSEEKKSPSGYTGQTQVPEGGCVHKECFQAYFDKLLGNGAKGSTPALEPSSATANEASASESAKAAAKSADVAKEVCPVCEKAIEDSSMEAPGKGWVHKACYPEAMAEKCKHCGELTYPQITGVEEKKSPSGFTGHIGVPGGGHIHTECLQAFFSAQQKETVSETKVEEKVSSSSAASPVVERKAAKSAADDESADICDFCGKEIPKGGGLIMFKEKKYHRPCLDKSQEKTCNFCKKAIPMGAVIIFEEKELHEECFDKVIAAQFGGEVKA
mmetsp:Transcript_13480/g.31696  ORF Transcript_13480/g.31696 Transcript_13480/m.31696 type:complete len:881 (-) Transcript_13480:93-2735(-)